MRCVRFMRLRPALASMMQVYGEEGESSFERRVSLSRRYDEKVDDVTGERGLHVAATFLDSEMRVKVHELRFPPDGTRANDRAGGKVVQRFVC